MNGGAPASHDYVDRRLERIEQRIERYEDMTLRLGEDILARVRDVEHRLDQLEGERRGGSNTWHWIVTALGAGAAVFSIISIIIAISR